MNTYIKNVGVMAGGLTGTHGPEPTQYAGRQFQYYGHESEALDAMMAKYASNYVKGRVQGSKRHTRDGEQFHYRRGLQKRAL